MSEKQEPRENQLAAYIGVSGPETPKFLLVNNFLSEFFQTSPNEKKKSYTFDDFVLDEKEILRCEEDDEQKMQQLKNSFNEFFRRFAGEDIIHSNYKERVFYFPLHLHMLRSSTYNLRHLLFHMIPNIEKENRFRDIQNMLIEYLYGNTDGASFLLNTLCSELFEENAVKKAGKKTQEFEPLQKNHYKKVCNNFYKDLQLLLTHAFFKKLDFYKRYDYLATLLNSYVIQFIVNKEGVSHRGILLCQGSATSHLLNGTEYHRACVQNYSEIRSVFSQELKEYYLKCLEKEGDLKIQDINDKIMVNSETFKEFVERLFNSKYQDEESLYQLVRKAFKLEGKEKTLKKEEFTMYYIDMSKVRKGSVLTKISSTLPTCGKDIDFVFPKNSSKHKFFAMSPSLLEFFVRLFLVHEKRSYAYLDNFLDWLQDRYGICIRKSPKIDRMLKKMHIKIPLSEYRQNEQALLDNLDEINCLIRLSDSGYVITLPEEKGEFKLL